MANDERYIYEGQELELFRDAKNWKAYFRRLLGRYIQGDVLEVGAGLGATTKALCHGPVRSWTCLEPDPELARRLSDRVGPAAGLPLVPTIVVGTLGAMPVTRWFDTILYIDVLEHIEDDNAEAVLAAKLLRPGGALVVLAPAHPFLFSPFDKAIGHHRRYNCGMLRRLTTPGCKLIHTFYLDSCGLLASLGNRFLLSSSLPTARQIAFWDSTLVRASTIVDLLTGHLIGKTVVGVWKSVGE